MDDVATIKKSSAVQEFEATQKVHDLLEALDAPARNRVLDHVVAMLGIASTAKVPKTAETLVPSGGADADVQHTDFAELFHAMDPQTDADRALAAGYWIQVVEKNEAFDAQRANKELKHLGHAVGNITQALNALIGQKPALVLQLKKSGLSRQARKTYKLSVTGIKLVKEKLGG